MLGVKEVVDVSRFMTITTANKRGKLKVLGRSKKKLRLKLGGLNTVFAIRPLVIEGLAMPFNLSGPFMRHHGIDQLHSQNSLRIQGRKIKLVTNPANQREVNAVCPVESAAYIDQAISVEPGTSRFVRLKIPDVTNGNRMAGDGVVEAVAHFVSHTDLHPAICALTTVQPDGRCWTSVMNTTDKPVNVTEGQRYGTFKVAPDLTKNSPEAAVKVQDRPDQWYLDQFKLKDSPFLQKEEDLQKALNLLKKYGDLFSTGDEYGKTKLLEHAIHTHEGPPIKCRNRPINPTLEPQLREQIDHWTKQDVIETSTSPWSFPLLAVPKKNGKVRWACDYRRLNDATIKDSFPLPNIEDNLARLSKSRIFSGIDGTGAFHVVSIRPEDREKTAFSTPWGLYQFKRMPFGLCNAPATYCRLVQKVLEGIPLSVAIPYLDDTCVHAANLPLHLKGLELVFEAHRKAGLTLQPSKCQLFQPEIEYLGHQISEQGIAVPSKYTKVVEEWPEPSTKKEVRVFIGKMSYYRRFIKNFSKIAHPLTEMIKDDAEDKDNEDFELTPEAKESFKTLKNELTVAPILAYPDFMSDKPFILDTDWSHDPGAIGAVLSQEQDGLERVIAYGARKLKASEANYSSHKGELLAVIFFMRHWKYYLQYRPFILRTDHEALKWIHKIEEPKGMILRWLETLSNFDFSVEFRKGKRHGNADALSRVEHAPDLEETEIKDELMSLVDLNAMQWFPMENPTSIREHQAEDEEIQQVVEWVRRELPPSRAEAKALSRNLRSYISIFDSLRLDKKCCLVRKNMNTGRIHDYLPCLPDNLRDHLMQRVHEQGGHRGVQNTLEQFNRRFYAPDAAVTAQKVVQTCHTCQRNARNPKSQRSILRSTVTGQPFQRWSIDFVGPLPASNKGNSYILTAKDCFTRWVEAFPTMNMTAVTVARILEREIISRYGTPENIHSDQGTQFTSELIKSLYEELGISGTHTPAYNPKSNPVERTHRDLGQLLRASLDEEPGDWEERLPSCLLAMRTAVSSATGFTPFHMVYGKECVLPLDFVYDNPYGKGRTVSDHVQKMTQGIKATFTAARINQNKAIQRSQQSFRNKCKGGPLIQGDRVWLFTPKTTSRSRKLQIRWTGPWLIIEEISPVLFRIKSGSWNTHQLEVVAALDRLKRYHDSNHPLEDASLNLTMEDLNLTDEHGEIHLPANETPNAEESHYPVDVELETGGIVLPHDDTPTQPGPDPGPDDGAPVQPIVPPEPVDPRPASPEWGESIDWGEPRHRSSPKPNDTDMKSVATKSDHEMSTRHSLMDQENLTDSLMESGHDGQSGSISKNKSISESGSFHGFDESDTAAAKTRAEKTIDPYAAFGGEIVPLPDSTQSVTGSPRISYPPSPASGARPKIPIKYDGEEEVDLSQALEAPAIPPALAGPPTALALPAPATSSPPPTARPTLALPAPGTPSVPSAAPRALALPAPAAPASPRLVVSPRPTAPPLTPPARTTPPETSPAARPLPLLPPLPVTSRLPPPGPSSGPAASTRSKTAAAAAKLFGPRAPKRPPPPTPPQASPSGKPVAKKKQQGRRPQVPEAAAWSEEDEDL